jgi:NAD-dependent protein deacetylase/lipoamidase
MPYFTIRPSALRPSVWGPRARPALLWQNEGSPLKVRDRSQAVRSGVRSDVRRPPGVPYRDRRRYAHPPVDALDRIAQWAGQARRGVVFTGAGISTESGIRDFRGPDGFWKRNDQTKFTIQNYVRDPEHRRERWRMAIQGESFMVRGVEPNAAHRAVARLEELGLVRGVITQNVDGLHKDAGSGRVLELHGNTKRIGCLSCEESWPRDEILDRVRAGEDDPKCVHCGGILKSQTISFGQSLPPDVLEEAHAWSLEADFFLVVGSSLIVYPAAALPSVAKQAGAKLVIVNQEPTDQDDIFDAVVQGTAGPVLTAIVERVERLTTG